MTVLIRCRNTDQHDSIANLINDFQEEYDVSIDWDSHNERLACIGGSSNSVLFVEIQGWGGIPIEDIEVGSTTMLNLLNLVTNHDGGWDDVW